MTKEPLAKVKVIKDGKEACVYARDTFICRYSFDYHDNPEKCAEEMKNSINHTAEEWAQKRVDDAVKSERERCAKRAESLYCKTYWDDPVAGIAAEIRGLK